MYNITGANKGMYDIVGLGWSVIMGTLNGKFLMRPFIEEIINNCYVKLKRGC